MKRLVIAAIIGYLISMAAYIGLATAVAVIAPVNRLPRLFDLTTTYTLWLGALGGIAGIASILVAQIARVLRAWLLQSN